MPGRDIDEQMLHDHIIKVLKKEYYNYPNAAHPNLMSYANHPQLTKSVFSIDHQELHPDIVVLDVRSDKVAVVVEVETESTVSAEERPEWVSFQKLDAKLHLYFPRGCGPKMAEFCAGFKHTELIQYAKQGDRYTIEKFAELD